MNDHDAKAELLQRLADGLEIPPEILNIAREALTMSDETAEQVIERVLTNPNAVDETGFVADDALAGQVADALRDAGLLPEGET